MPPEVLAWGTPECSGSNRPLLNPLGVSQDAPGRDAPTCPTGSFRTWIFKVQASLLCGPCHVHSRLRYRSHHVPRS